MAKSSVGLIVSAEVDIDERTGHTHGIYCHRPDRELLCEVGVKSVAGFLRSLIDMLGAIPCPALLDLGDIKLEEVVQPG